MLAAITALALFFSFLAAFYGYLAAPQQRLLPAPLPWRYAGDMAWRAALAALLLWVSRFGGYGVLVAIAAVLVGLGVLPLLALMRRFAWREWLLGGAARPDGWSRALAALCLGLPLALFCWLPFLRVLPPAMRGEAGAFFVWMVGISWLALCGGVYFLRNARSAWRLLFCANLLAALFFGLTA